MYCKNCGNQIPDESVFCFKCGTKILVENTSFQPTLDESTELVSSNVEKMQAKETDLSNKVNEIEKRKRKGNSKLRWVIIAISAIVLCIIICLVVNSALKCDFDYCNNFKTDGTDYCKQHACPVRYCYGAKNEDDFYCWFHTCGLDGCKRQKIDGGAYCSSHNCREKNCKNLRLAGGTGCVSHTCAVEGCLNLKLDAKYCYAHRIDMRKMLTDSSFGFKLNSAGGIVFSFRATNSTGKEIKYVRFKVYLYNAVGDRVNDELKRTNYVDVEIIGPVKARKMVSLSEKIIGYCDTCARIEIEDITIVFTDGTSETGSFNYYYMK